MDGEVSKRQRAVRIGRLTTLSEIATEIGRLYRAARQGKEDTLVAQRLATILTAMRQCLEIADVERHMADLEAAITAAAQSMSRRSGRREAHERPDADVGLGEGAPGLTSRWSCLKPEAGDQGNERSHHRVPRSGLKVCSKQEGNGS